MNEDVVELAKTFVGTKEIPRGSNSGPIVDKFTGGRREPWCAHFVSYLFNHVGRPLPNYKVPSKKQHNNYASVSYTERVFQDHDWLVLVPQAGDIVFYPTRDGSDSGTGRHIGLIVSVDLKARMYDSVEGNLSDSVALRKSVPFSKASNFGRRP